MSVNIYLIVNRNGRAVGYATDEFEALAAAPQGYEVLGPVQEVHPAMFASRAEQYAFTGLSAWENEDVLL
jgi:hypothetical protein